MKRMVAIMALLVLGMGCGRNEPGTMGGEPGVPETVATGAPAEVEETGGVDPQESAAAQERAASSYGVVDTNNTEQTGAGMKPGQEVKDQ